MKRKYSSSWKSSKQPRKQRKYRQNAPLHIKQKLVQNGINFFLNPEIYSFCFMPTNRHFFTVTVSKEPSWALGEPTTLFRVPVLQREPLGGYRSQWEGSGTCQNQLIPQEVGGFVASRWRLAPPRPWAGHRPVF